MTAASTSSDSTTRARPSISVRTLLADPDLGVKLGVLAGEEGLDRLVRHSRIQKSGLALVGHFHGIVASRIQIFGQTELSFLQGLSPETRTQALKAFFALELSCVIVTSGSKSDANVEGAGFAPVAELVEEARASHTPLLHSHERSSKTIAALHTLLDDRLAPRMRMHGVLVDVFGVGVLLSGASAIGKSECALDLVMRGHRLVADDVVECDYRPPGMVFGASAELLRHHLEVRGLGILNVKDLFGVTSTRGRKRIDVVIKLVEWSKDTEYDRLGLEDRHRLILGVKVRELVIPVRPGRDMSTIIEVAARNELLRRAGHHPARAFFGNLEGTLLGGETEDRPSGTSFVPEGVSPSEPPSDKEGVISS